MKIQVQVTQALIQHATAIFATKLDKSLIQFRKTRADQPGDLTLLLFPFTKLVKEPLPDLAKKIAELLISEVNAVANFNIVGGFLNLGFSDNYCLSLLQQANEIDNYGFAEQASKPRMLRAFQRSLYSQLSVS